MLPADDLKVKIAENELTIRIKSSANEIMTSINVKPPTG